MGGFLNDMSDEAQQEIELLNQEIAELQEKIKASEKEVRELSEREARGEGVFASRLFELKQGKMMLITQIQHKKVRLNHLLIK